MIIYAVGVNHKTAPVHLRERLHLTSDEIAMALGKLRESLIKEGLIVSTCNRTELYAIPRSEDLSGAELVQALQALRPDAPLHDQHFFRTFTCGAVKHLFRVAAALDSQVLGDMQILGQMKTSFEIAAQEGTLGNVFNRLYMGAMHTGKRVRSETGIGIGAVSISFAAVELARKIFSDLHRKKVLLIGTGETGTLAAKHLNAKGVPDITLTNRTHEKAVALASELNAKVVPYADFTSVLHGMDIVISATASPDIVVDYSMIAEAMKGRQNRPMLLIDIAMPRDIDPKIDTLPNVFLKDLDSLQGIVDQNLAKRRDEIPKADLIVTEEVVNFFLWYNSLGAAPAIQQLRDKFEQVRQAEVEKFRNKLGAVDTDVVEQLTKRIVNKLLHPTMVSLKQPVEDGRILENRLQVLRELFDLEEPPINEILPLLEDND